MKPFISRSVPFKVFTSLIILLFSISSCQTDVDQFFDEELAKNSSNSNNNEFIQETNPDTPTAINDGCSNVGFVLNGSINNSEVYPLLHKLTLDRPEERDGLYSIAIHQLKRFAGSDMLSISSFNGKAAITFEKDTDIDEISYFGYNLFVMPNLSNSTDNSLSSNNALLPYGTYNILQEIDLNDREFMLVIDAPFYSFGSFQNQRDWAITLVSEELETVHEIFKLIDEYETSDYFEFQMDSYILQSTIDFIQVDLELDCGTTTKIYDRDFNQI